MATITSEFEIGDKLYTMYGNKIVLARVKDFSLSYGDEPLEERFKYDMDFGEHSNILVLPLTYERSKKGSELFRTLPDIVNYLTSNVHDFTKDE